MADSALVVSGVENALGVTEKGKLPGTAIGCGSGGEFILCGSANLIGASNDHAEKIAVTFSRDQIGIQQTGCFRGRFGSVA